MARAWAITVGARNLRLGVKDVVENYGGIVPHDRKTMESLKGVGSYTAGAVLSYGVQRTRSGCRWQCIAHLCSVYIAFLTIF